MNFKFRHLLLVFKLSIFYDLSVNLDFSQDDHFFGPCHLQHFKDQSIDQVRVIKLVSNYITTVTNNAYKEVSDDIFRLKQQLNYETSSVMNSIKSILALNPNLQMDEFQAIDKKFKKISKNPRNIIENIIDFFQVANDRLFAAFLQQSKLSKSTHICVASAYNRICQQDIARRLEKLRPLNQIFDLITSSLKDIEKTIAIVHEYIQQKSCLHSLARAFTYTSACHLLFQINRQNPKTNLEDNKHPDLKSQNYQYGDQNGDQDGDQYGDARLRNTSNSVEVSDNISGIARSKTKFESFKNDEEDVLGSTNNFFEISDFKINEQKSSALSEINTSGTVPKNLIVKLKSNFLKKNVSKFSTSVPLPTSLYHSISTPQLSMNQKNHHILPLCRSHCSHVIQTCTKPVTEALIEQFLLLEEKLKMYLTISEYFQEKDIPGRLGKERFNYGTVVSKLFSKDLYTLSKCLHEVHESCTQRINKKFNPELFNDSPTVLNFSTSRHINAISNIVTSFNHRMKSFADDVCASLDATMISDDEQNCWKESLNSEPNFQTNKTYLKEISDKLFVNIKLLNLQKISMMQSDTAKTADDTMADLEQSGDLTESGNSGSGSGDYDDNLNFIVVTKSPKGNDITADEFLHQTFFTTPREINPKINFTQRSLTAKLLLQSTFNILHKEQPIISQNSPKSSPTLLHSVFHTDHTESSLIYTNEINPSLTSLLPKAETYQRQLNFKENIPIEEEKSVEYKNVFSKAHRTFFSYLAFLIFLFFVYGQ